MKNTILLIDDDQDLVAMLKSFLELKDFDVCFACHPRDIPSDLSHVDLVLLDINMPKEDGFSLYNKLRKNWTMPILFLTARGNEDDKIKGLMMGGDDYITKPFSLEELYARIYTNLKRNERLGSNQDYEIKGGVFFLLQKELPLTRAEFEILELLLHHPKQVFSKEQIYDTLWGYDADGHAQVVSEHIRNIRNKMKKVTETEYIKTHWGMGYSWIG